MTKSFVHLASLRLTPGVDAAAVRAAVTAELCGSVEHEGQCRWPHHTTVELDCDTAVFRTVFFASETEEREVRTRIRAALRSCDDWSVVSDRTGSLQPGESSLAKSLLRKPANRRDVEPSQ